MSGLAAATAAVAVTPAPRAVQIKRPANAKSSGGALLTAVSCTAPKACGAAGEYVDSADHNQVMLVSEVNGHWARGQELKLPKGAPKQPGAAVNSIACTAPGTCIAGGSYIVKGEFFGFVAAESHGVWTRARKLGPPPAAPQLNYVISAVSCVITGECAAVGGFRDNHGAAQIFTVSQVKGTWGRPAKLTLPANVNANAGALAFGVSCALPGSCVTVGEYNNKAMVATSFAATESGGKWHAAVEIVLPKDADAASPSAPLAVSCPVPGGCVAVGSYQDAHGNGRSYTLTENKGHWRHASTFTKVPSNAAANSSPALTGVTCPIPGSCVAVGNYTEQSGGHAAFAAFRHGGHWLGGLQVLPPASSKTGSAMLAFLSGVSCTTTPFCATVGFYNTKTGQNAAMGAALQLPASAG